VIHFAALKAVGESMQKPFEYYDNNIVATLNLLKLMDEFQVRNLVFSSSCTVYGDSDQQPLTEHFPKQPCASPYGWTKSINEDMLMGLCQSTALKVCALRYFNPIGAHPSGLIGEEAHGVPSNLLPYVIKTATGEYPCVRVFGDDYPTPDGTCLRDYIHVMDLVAAHFHAITWVSKQKS
jgi:UDP-glucose 4-epimerase